MLRGNALAKLDGKGRLKLPARFRSIIEPRYGDEFFVTSLRGDSVRIYPMAVYAKIEERLAGSSTVNPSLTKLRNALNYYGQSAVMDAQGRILIHPIPRESAGINGEVAVLGQQNFLEVWDHATFKARMKKHPLTDEDATVLTEYGF